ncbi:GxxExxY protein [Cognataquiflexum nitidum]|uniref:GxxExxY protein n=1 Tax=Cognataquiflexum nitidum TaxID=2922272 RepID=UPI00300C37FF
MNSLTQKIIGESIYVHKELGPGLLESAYQKCLCHRLISVGLSIEIALPVYFDGIFLDCGYRLDLVVEKTVVIEIKSIKKLKEIHLAQMLTYLKLGKYPLGLLINFKEKRLVDGLKRVIL